MADILPLSDIPIVSIDGRLLPLTEAASNWSDEIERRVGGIDGTIEVDAAQVTGGVFPDGRISESSVTQHEAALGVAGSQINSGTIPDARVSKSSVTQHAIPKPAVNAQTENYTLTGSDVFDVVTMDNALSRTITIPVGQTDYVDIWRLGAGAVTVEGASGVTVNGSDGGSDTISSQWSRVRAQEIGTNVWAVG